MSNSIYQQQSDLLRKTETPLSDKEKLAVLEKAATWMTEFMIYYPGSKNPVFETTARFVDNIRQAWRGEFTEEEKQHKYELAYVKLRNFLDRKN